MRKHQHRKPYSKKLHFYMRKHQHRKPYKVIKDIIISPLDTKGERCLVVVILEKYLSIPEGKARLNLVLRRTISKKTQIFKIQIIDTLKLRIGWNQCFGYCDNSNKSNK